MVFLTSLLYFSTNKILQYQKIKNYILQLPLHLQTVVKEAYTPALMPINTLTLQSYGVRRTHAESENKFNVTVQLKASEAAAAVLVSRWEWSCLHPSHCFWTDGQTQAECTKFGSFFGKKSDTSSFE